VEVLPLVPVRWITGYAFCGSPSSSTSRRIRSSVGEILFSGQRAWSFADTSAYEVFVIRLPSLRRVLPAGRAAVIHRLR
jgi:hypothetical protein